jgi:hypothetical protein
MKTRILAGFVIAGLLVTPAAAQFMGVGPLQVNDLLGNFKLAQQLVNQATQLANEAKNLAKIPPLNFGNIQGEVASVSAQANNIPVQFRGIVASAQILQNTPTDVARTVAIDASSTSAQGVVGQQQATNAHLGNLENIGSQGNAAAAARDQAAAVKNAVYTDDMVTILGGKKQ